jgi:tubby-related protein 1
LTGSSHSSLFSSLGLSFPLRAPRSYECFLQADDTFILGCRKQTSSKTPQYSFTTARKTYDKRSVHYVGKLRSNFMGTEFMAYDYGLNPAKMEPAALARTQDMART